MAQAHRLSEATLQDIIKRIVAVAQPERIILFGSATRQEMGPHSDVDILVVKHGNDHPSQIVGAIYLGLYGIRQAVDVLAVTPAQIEHYVTSTASSALQRCARAQRSIMPLRYPPDDPREWLNRARSILALARTLSAPRVVATCWHNGSEHQAKYTALQR